MLDTEITESFMGGAAKAQKAGAHHQDLQQHFRVEELRDRVSVSLWTGYRIQGLRPKVQTSRPYLELPKPMAPCEVFSCSYWLRRLDRF